MKNFEYDENKSQANLAKHGIDFIEAQRLWEDSNRLEVPTRSEYEKRFLVIAKINDRHWSGVITYRAQTTRIISVRRSRPKEVALYESPRI